MTDYTDEDTITLRSAAFGAMMLVSAADPGFLVTFKESLAGAKALAAAPPDLQALFKGGGMPSMPKGSDAEIEADVLGQLQRAIAILQAKAPQDLQSYRDVIVAACDEVANASKGVAESEAAAIAKIKSAMGAP
jgi:hypothetical protein